MLSIRALSWTNMVSLSQVDKIIFTLVLAWFFPMALHTLPLTSATALGQTWLPIFWAPLIAALCFRPHVALVAGLCAPLINHFLFGMPNDQVVLSLTFHLAVFSAAVLLIRRRLQPAGWAVAAVYASTLFLTRLIFARASLGEVMDVFLSSMATAIPGILILIVLTEAVRQFNKRHDV